MRHAVKTIPTGWGGTRATVAEAYRLVNGSLTDPVVVTTAQDIVRHLPERDKLAEVRAVSNYVRANVRYTNEGIETLKAPRLMLDEIKYKGKAVGDCDDHVILWAALHKAVGNPVRFRVISQRADKLANHIYGEVYVPRYGWIGDELIVKHKPLGWHIPAREVTKSVAFVGGLGGLTEGDMYSVFKPGGARHTMDGSMRPRKELFAVSPFIARGYKVKHGGALQMRGDGMVEQIGILPVAALAPLASKFLPKLLKKFKLGGKKKKKHKGGGAPACPAGYHYVAGVGLAGG